MFPIIVQLSKGNETTTVVATYNEPLPEPIARVLLATMLRKRLPDWKVETVELADHHYDFQAGGALSDPSKN